MDNHDKAHYALHALLAAALVGAVVLMMWGVVHVPVVLQ